MKKPLGLVLPLVVIVVVIFLVAHLDTRVGVPNTASPEIAAAPGAATTTLSVSILPTDILQGDPVEIVVHGVSATSSIASLTFSGKPLPVFLVDGEPHAVVGIDLKEPSGSYPVVLTLTDGQVVKQNLVVGTRVIAVVPLGIPASLGGNTPAGQAKLVSSLAEDNAVLNAVPSVNAVLWNGQFQYPVANPVVTDTYGYTRLTVATTISHKGTDFHAPPGTPVMAMNSGTVRLARFFTAYGNTIVIDHGFGIQTLYMHMSLLDVKEGAHVEKGQVIGKSGMTGYAEGPHLHISVKIGSISIDPLKFLKLF